MDKVPQRRTAHLAVLALATACLVWGNTCGAKAGVGAPATETTSQVPTADVSRLNGELRSYFTQLKKGRASPKWKPSDDAPVLRSMEGAIVQFILAQLDRRPDISGANIAGVVAKATATAAWVSVFGTTPASADQAWESELRTPAPAFMLRGTGAGAHHAVAGIWLGYGNVYRYTIHGFAKRGRAYTDVARLAESWDNHFVHALQLSPFRADEMRFLVYGVYIGSPEGLTKIVEYSFDGHTLSAVWGRDRVQGATASLSGRRVVVFSLDTQGVYWREVYEQTRGGLKLLSRKHSLKPFPGQPRVRRP